MFLQLELGVGTEPKAIVESMQMVRALGRVERMKFHYRSVSKLLSLPIMRRQRRPVLMKSTLTLSRMVKDL